jgi:alpha-glucosidase
MSTPSDTTRAQTNFYATASPDGKITHAIYLEDGRLFHHVTFNGLQILAPSVMGIKIPDADFYDGLTFIGTSITSWNNTYTLPAGKKSVYVDNPVQREYIVQKGTRMLRIIIRVYNDGIAFRYRIEGPGGSFIDEEYTEYNIPAGTGGWGQSWVVNYETIWQYYSSGSAVDDLAMPFLASYSNDTVWALFTEANLINSNATYCPSVLKGNVGGHLNLIHAPDPDQAKLGNQVQVALPFQSPWRAVIIADNLNDLVNSPLVQNVNPESKIADMSWIKPGRVAWSWWSTYSFTNDDGLSPNSVQRIQTYQQQKEYVDFAASMGWEYVTVDAGWVYWTDGTVAELCEYASGKGVGIILWGSYELWSPYGTSLMNIKTWASWGVAGIKIDIIEKDSQIGMAFMEEMSLYCAELGLLLALHSSSKPGGENRTWPNIITTEGILGNEHYWLYWPPLPTAVHNCIVPFTRNAVGSMDYTPVGISNSNRNTTQGHQLALSVVFESGLQHFADSIDIYAVWRGTEFLSVVHAAWDETKVLDGLPGKYVTIARRKGSDWCIGAITTDAKTAVIRLSDLALEAGSYTAYIYKDGESQDYLVKEISTVNSASILQIPMLESGGCSVLISKQTVPSMPSDPYTPYEAEDATLVGTAVISDDANCSGGKKVGYMGNGGELIFSVTVPRTDVYKVRIYYLSADPRSLSCSINGAAGYDLEIAYGSGSWSVVRIFPVSMSLNAGSNTIRLYHTDWAPDIDKIGILIDN